MAIKLGGSVKTRVNLNNYIEVELTDAGSQHYSNYHNRIACMLRTDQRDEYLQRHVSKPHQTIKMQLHHFIKIFGGQDTLDLHDLVKLSTIIYVDEIIQEQ